MTSSKIIDKVKNDIAEHGWHVLSVSCSDSPNFSYTVGFEQTLGHPEIIMSGLKIDLMHQLLNDIGGLIKEGESFTNGDLSNEVIRGFPVKFVALNENSTEEYLRVAKAHYENGSIRALQCIWPDSNGVFQSASNNAQELFG
ncbi:MAG: DUF4262 domain-containing protein [Pseudomonadota bacterium]